MTVVLAPLALLLLLPLAVTAARQRTLAAMALRSIRRRRSEALLVVGGALLGTAIITSALVVGDIIESSLTDAARTQHGPIDLVVTVQEGTSLDEVSTAITQADVAQLEALLPASTAVATLEAPAQGRAAPRVRLLEVDLAAGRAFGSDARITGLADVRATGEQVVVNARTAERLGVVAGDAVRLHAYGGTLDLNVGAVVPEVGLAGYGGAVVGPGTIDRLAIAAGTAPARHLLVSLAGGVLDTREETDHALAQVREALADVPGVQVAAEKAAVLDDAEQAGASMTELFSTVGAFSVLAGILLLVNLFVMLAEERRSELGMLRALGFTRRRLSRVFAIEGACYAVVASALGAVAGVGVGWVVARVAGSVLNSSGRTLDLALVIEPTSLVGGALAGLVVCLATVWLTSRRIARLNVILAIRDLPETHARRPRARTLVLAGLGALLGAAMTAAAFLGEDPVALLLGVPVAAFSSAPLLRRVLPEQTARLGVAVTVLGWGLGALPLFPEIMGGLDTAAFVVQGVVLTAGAVSLAVALDGVWRIAIDRLGRGRGALAARLGVAYPLARRFRAGMLLAMFSLVLFTVTIISAVTATFERSTDQMVDDLAAGYDLILDASPADPIPVEALLARDDVTAVAPLVHGIASFDADHLDAARPWPITGFDDRLLARGAPRLFRRDEAFATDAEVYRAVLADPTLAIVPEGFAVPEMATPILGVGDTVTVLDRDGRRRDLTIAALSELDWLGSGALVGADVAAEVLDGQGVGARSYVAVATEVDPEVVAAALDADFLASGAQTVTFTALITRGMGQQLRFMALVQGFLGLGLLVGISGLAVVMVRAVRERRQQIGMLRAMGFSTGLVRSILLIEAGLVAVQGTVIGAVLGLVTTRQLLASGDAFGDGQLAFHVPWGALALIVGLPLAAALAATAWPATRAARLSPVLALRNVD